MLTPDQLAAIRARAEKADPGPWFDEPSGTPYAREVCVRETNEHVCDCEHCECDEQDVEIAAIAYVEHGEPGKARSNAAFISAARTDVPALLAHVDALEQSACGLAFDAGRRIEELESAQRRMLAGHIGPMSVLATLRARCMTEGAIQIEMKDLLY